jgi:tellurite methyltransferase
MEDIKELLGSTDIYLIDQILKVNFDSQQLVLDAGCGNGRNLTYFIHNDFPVYGIDKNSDVIRQLLYELKSAGKEYPSDRFVVAETEALPYPDKMFDLVISSAVLHFAENEEHFGRMFAELIRVLKHGGMLFARIACDVGMKDEMKPMGEGKFLMPDGTVRFLLTQSLLAEIMKKYGLIFIEPFKTVLVHEKRSMSALVLRKN